MVEVWTVRTGDVSLADRVAFERLLEPHERAAVHARVFERHRHEYLVTRALCRAVLGHVLGLAPGPLRFRRNAYGRPELDPPGRLRFNLTNTVELVAIAVTDEGDVGIDAEPRSRADSILGLGSAVFTPTERADLSMLPIEMRRARAMHRWTLKEAYMKARGLGFSLPPASFEIDFSNGGPALRLMPPIEDLASRWHLELREIDDHVLAICRARGPTTVVMHRADLRKLLREADD